MGDDEVRELAYRESMSDQSIHSARARHIWERGWDARGDHDAAGRERLASIISPARLIELAEWIDLVYPNDPHPEVQNDLRRLAGALAALDAPDA